MQIREGLQKQCFIKMQQGLFSGECQILFFFHFYYAFHNLYDV